MARTKGDFNFSANFEVKKKATLDARQYVNSYSELFEFTEDDYIPYGFPVACGGQDDPSKLGIWQCVNPNDLSNPLSWIRGNEPIPFNQVIQIGSFTLNTTTYLATLGETIDWGFNESGINYEVGDTDVQMSAPDEDFTRADIIVWDSINGYQVIEGIAAEDYQIPNTPIDTILVQTVIRNVDGTVEPVEPPDLSGYAKLTGGNEYTGNQNINGEVNVNNGGIRTNRRIEFYRRDTNPKPPFPSSIPNFGIGINDNASNNMTVEKYAGGGQTAKRLAEWDYTTGVLDFKDNPTVNGVPIGGGGASDFSDLGGDPYDNTALAEDLNRIEGKADVAQEDIDDHIIRTDNPHSVTKGQVGLGNVPNTDATNPANISQSADYRFVTDAEKSTWNGKLAGTLAPDANLQTQTTPTEDNQFVSRHGLIFFWNWLRTQTAIITGRWQFAGIGAGIASNVASFLNIAVNTASVGQILLPPSSVDTATTIAGLIWNNTMEFKFYDNVTGAVNRLLKLNGNSALANSNPLNVVTSTGTGGNIGTLKAEVAFGRYPTAVSYTVLLTDVGFGWIIAVTDTSSARTITLPLANAVPAGWQITVKDESGAAGTNNITIALSGSDTTDTTNITTNGGSRLLYSDGTSKWFQI